MVGNPYHRCRVVGVMNDLRKRAEQVAHDLLGTAGTMPDDVIETEGLAELVDDMVMECGFCGWWVDPNELDEDQMCADCSNAEDD